MLISIIYIPSPPLHLPCPVDYCLKRWIDQSVNQFFEPILFCGFEEFLEFSMPTEYIFIYDDCWCSLTKIKLFPNISTILKFWNLSCATDLPLWLSVNYIFFIFEEEKIEKQRYNYIPCPTLIYTCTFLLIFILQQHICFYSPCGTTLLMAKEEYENILFKYLF